MRLSARMGLASGVLGAALAVVFLVLVLSIGDQRATAHAAYTSARVIDAANRLRSSLLDIEAAERGYLITRQPRFLASFNTGRATWPADGARLRKLVAGDPAQSRRAAAITLGVYHYVDDEARPLLAKAKRGLSRSAQSAAVGRSKGKLDTLRRGFDTFIRREEAISAVHDRQATSSAHRSRVLGAIGLAVTLSILALFTWVIARSVVQPIRRVAGAARDLAGGDLAARVPRREGGSEVHELGRDFNAMAASLQDQRGRLEEQYAALGTQRAELEGAVERLAAEKERMARFLDFAHRLDAAGEVDALGEEILEQLGELAGAERGALYATELDRGRTRAVLARRGVVEPPPLPRGGAVARALAEGQTVSLDAEDPARLFDGEREAGAELVVPLIHGGTTAGLLVLGRHQGTFSDQAVEEVEALAQQAAASLASALALRRARENASVIRAVLDSTPDAIALLDRAGRTVLENPPMRAVRQALVESVRTPGGGHRVNVNVLGSDRGGEVRDELELLGTGRTFARYAAPVRDGGGAMIGRLTVLREITGEREAERLKDEFFALVSHELRTPLTSIIGYLELVLDEGDALIPEQRRYLEVVQRNATRLLRLVGDLLFVAQVEAGKLSLDPGTVSLPKLVEEAVEAARPRAETRAIVLRAEVEPVAESRGDRDRLGQVLDNLVTNALKFTPEQGEVTVRLRRHGRSAALEVADNGMGIPADEQHHLFERFFRASTATAHAVPGVGLGLTIVKAIVEAHGGEVSVTSAPDVGTTFRVELPLRAPEPPL